MPRRPGMMKRRKQWGSPGDRSQIGLMRQPAAPGQGERLPGRKPSGKGARGDGWEKISKGAYAAVCRTH